MTAGWMYLYSPALDLEVLRDRKSTRLNSSHSQISYAVFCLKKKNARQAADDAAPRPLQLERPGAPPDFTLSARPGTLTASFGFHFPDYLSSIVGVHILPLSW